ncbi:MAG: hypothetical protein GH144_06630 [Clostridia bacterium]|jgi:hypothetical protein|nr:hypothetical protein [Clostridia bacterium]
MPGEENIAGILAERELQRKKEEDFDNKLKEMDKKISQMGKNFDKVFLGLDGLGKAEGKKNILDFSPQEHWNEIKKSTHGFEDMDTIFSDRFATNQEFRKQALDALSDEKVVEMVKNKELDAILTGVCKDEACRTDLASRVKQAQKGTEKKLF